MAQKGLKDDTPIARLDLSAISLRCVSDGKTAMGAILTLHVFCVQFCQHCQGLFQHRLAFPAYSCNMPARASNYYCRWHSGWQYTTLHAAQHLPGAKSTAPTRPGRRFADSDRILSHHAAGQWCFYTEPHAALTRPPCCLLPLSPRCQHWKTWSWCNWCWQ